MSENFEPRSAKDPILSPADRLILKQRTQTSIRLEFMQELLMPGTLSSVGAGYVTSHTQARRSPSLTPFIASPRWPTGWRDQGIYQQFFGTNQGKTYRRDTVPCQKV